MCKKKHRFGAGYFLLFWNRWSLHACLCLSLSLCAWGVCVRVFATSSTHHHWALYDYEMGTIDIDLIHPDHLSKDDYLSVLCRDNLLCLRSSKYSSMLCYSNSQYQKNMEETVEYQEAAERNWKDTDDRKARWKVGRNEQRSEVTNQRQWDKNEGEGSTQRFLIRAWQVMG